jgi:hypothetical protein
VERRGIARRWAAGIELKGGRDTVHGGHEPWRGWRAGRPVHGRTASPLDEGGGGGASALM